MKILVIEDSERLLRSLGRSLTKAGFAVDHSPEFDFERTPDLLRFTTPTVVDAKGTSTTLSG